MDTLTLCFIGICIALVVAVCVMGYICQQLENYINNNILNKD